MPGWIRSLLNSTFPMCFTIEVHLNRKAIENRFKVDTSRLFEFDFNYFYKAFTHPAIPVISQKEPHLAILMDWGLIPGWSSDRDKAEQIRKGTYNARAETLHEKPAFRKAFQQGRCLVIAHGFFEWQHKEGQKIPWYIRLKNEKPFVFAGLHDTWADPATGEILQTFSIVTTRANPLMEHIHNTKKRMPVILPEAREMEWIHEEMSLRQARQLLLPFDEKELHAHTISPMVSSPGVKPDDPAIVEPYSNPPSEELF